ncbi:hypothetical protein HDA40_008152 [Hamadaea flava]|nr:hypothetical protein [Hamadaea flava]
MRLCVRCRERPEFDRHPADRMSRKSARPTPFGAGLVSHSRLVVGGRRNGEPSK